MTYLPRRRRNQHLLASSFDSDAQAYFDAAGITDSTEKEAWNDFVVGAKAAGIWNKAHRIYPVSPTSIGAAAYCAKSLIQGSFVNSPTHASTGVTFDGATQYFNIDDSLDNIMGVGGNTSNSYGVYNRTEISIGATRYAFGADASTGGDALIYHTTTPALIIRNNQVNNNLSTTSIPLGAEGWILGTRESATYAGLYRGNVLYDTFTTSTSLAPAPGIIPVFGARRTALSVAGFLNYEWAFGWIGSGLTTTECEDLYDLVQAYQTALGRAI